MDQEPLVKDQIDAGKRFLLEFDKVAPIKCAAWLKEADSGRRYLYVISDSWNDINVDVAYGHVIQIVSKMAKPRLDPFRVKVIGANTATAAQVLGIQQSYSAGTTPPPWHEPAGRTEDAYLYTLPIGLATS